jgi:hypothetical protein
MVMLSSLHIEIHEGEIRLHAIAAQDDEDSNAIFCLSPQQAYELGEKLIISARTLAARHAAHFSN